MEAKQGATMKKVIAEVPIHPALERLVDALARKLVRDFLSGKLPPLPDEVVSNTTKKTERRAVATRRSRRK